MRARAIKKTRHAGKPGLPEYKDGTKAVFDYEVRLLPEDGDPDEIAQQNSTDFPVIEDTRKAWPNGYGEPLEIVFGKQFSLPVFEECLRTMQVEEVSSFDIETLDLLPYPMMSKKLRDIAKERIQRDKGEPVAPSHGCCWSQMAHSQGLGYQYLDELVGQPRRLRFTLHLHQVLQPDDYEQSAWQLDDAQKEQSIEQLRLKGAAAYAANDWRLAGEKYMEAVIRLDNLMLNEKPGEPEHVELDGRKLPFYLNLSQCELRRGNYYDAVRYATEALQRDADSEKGLYRRAQAYMALRELDAAETDLQHLAQSHASSSAALAAAKLKECAQLRAELKANDKQTYKNVLA